MNEQSLLRLVAYARELDSTVFLFQDSRPLDDWYESALENVSVKRAVPLSTIDRYPDALCVITANDLPALDALKGDTYEIAVLHLSLAQANLLLEFYCRLFDRFRRINVSFTDVNSCELADVYTYKNALLRINAGFIELLSRNPTEINRLTDLLLVNKSRPCGAGYAHASMGPDGAWYICPHFYFDCRLQDAGRVDAPDSHPFRAYLDPARFSLCSKCACHQCSRCIYLHKKYSGEFSTPPARQCMLSHFELANAAIVSEILRNKIGLDWPQKVMRPNHLDPLHRAVPVMDAFEKKLWECIAFIDSESAAFSGIRMKADAPIVSKLELDEIITITERISGLKEMLAEPIRLNGLTETLDVTTQEMKMELNRLNEKLRAWWVDAKRRYIADDKTGPFHIDFQTGEIFRRH